METSSAPQSWSAMTLLHEGSGIDLEEDGDDGRQQKGGKKKRLSIQQVRSLEVCFEAENKLEPERKLQISQELGLEPRQVAIWFQNRRARWKTKQLEKDYELLKHNYDTLKSKFDAVHHDNKHLSAQVTNQVSLLKERLGDSRHDKMEVKSESREDSEVKWMEFGSEKQYESEGSSAILNEVCSYKMANNNNSVMKKNKESPNQNNSDGYMSGSMAPNLVTCDIHITHPNDESLCFTATDTDTATHDHHHTHHHHHHPPSHINFLQEDACNIVNVVDNPSAMAFQLWEWS